jgi:tight adherence protein C
VLVGAIGTAAYALVAGRERRDLMMRFEVGASAAPIAPLLTPSTGSAADRIGQWIGERLPQTLTEGIGADKLLHAGFEGRYAIPLYAAVRLGMGVLVPAATFVAIAGQRGTMFLAYMVLAIAIGILGPAAGLDRMIQNRRDRIRRGIPDALDLLVVCVEAGVSLDAAILRVSREVATAHPDLAGELAIVTRKVNAGVPREQALNGLWARTGLDELRGLAANMVQSDRWGTSIARVLRVNAETLRRKRKQTAEKKAAEASLKMLGPLLLFMFPALFVVILGPAFIRISEGFGGAF